MMNRIQILLFISTLFCLSPLTIAQESDPVHKVKPKQTDKNQRPIKQSAPLYRTIDNDNILIFELETGRVTFELANFFAPNHVKRIKNLVREGFYDGLPLYRVIENFVVQGGDSSGKKPTKFRSEMHNEFTRSITKDTHFTLVQQPDLLAEQTGFIDGFAVGRSVTDNKEWLIHCPGTINLARGIDPNSGTTDFAIMYGQATRHLDRNMSVFGRIIDGWDSFYRVNRAPIETGGVFGDESKATKIIKASILKDLPESQSTKYEIENTNTPSFKSKIQQRKKLTNAFFHYKGNGNLDICYIRRDLKITQK
jgi:peptidylprolyl isomerase